MLSSIWNFVLYEPLLNALAFLVSVIPGGDVGLAVIALTIIVKIILLPLSHRSIESQAEMNLLAPELNKIKSSGASKEEQARQTFELYKKHKVNPFSGCLLVLVQIPIIFALYYVFYKGISFQNGYLYSFIHVPDNVNMMFLGLMDITGKSVVLGILAGVSQYLQAHFMPARIATQSVAGGPKAGVDSFAESFQKSMHLQMKYVFPFVVAFIAYSISGAVALYWITSNIFMTAQQLYVKKKEYGQK
ncbi:MAG: YidC/Oxa1 family membrane protein insertase [Candidatus Colwellbacteria bacterium]|nr:YidC/Oxa1 family membrane protein insertase [Candidatus Colwellbacteria bacterium]